jgi:hypothetical protein
MNPAASRSCKGQQTEQSKPASREAEARPETRANVIGSLRFEPEAVHS